MDRKKPLLKFLLIVSLLIPGACALAAPEPFTLHLRPDGAPSPMPAKSEATEKMITFYGGTTPARLSEITDPTITIYRPEKPSGTAVVVAPGGGFMLLSYSFEGTQVCE